MSKNSRVLLAIGIAATLLIGGTLSVQAAPAALNVGSIDINCIRANTGSGIDLDKMLACADITQPGRNDASPCVSAKDLISHLSSKNDRCASLPDVNAMLGKWLKGNCTVAIQAPKPNDEPAAPSAAPSAVAQPTPAATATPAATPAPQPSATAAPSPTAAVTATPKPTATPIATPTATPVATPKPTATPAPTAAPTVPSTGAHTALEASMIQMVNQERTAAGLKPYIADSSLRTPALRHSQDMADNNFFSHTSPTQGTFSQRLSASGVGTRSAGENLAHYGTVQRAHEALMTSTGHRANIMNSNFTHIGIGIVSKNNAYYITQWFGRY